MKRSVRDRRGEEWASYGVYRVGWQGICNSGNRDTGLRLRELDWSASWRVQSVVY